MPVVFYAFAGYFLLAVVLTYPLVRAITIAVSDPVDPLLNTWIMAWEHHALLTRPLEFLNANIFYPYSQTLLYSETLLVPSLLLLPVNAAGGSAILAHNVLVLMGFAMTGVSGYLLGRWLFRSHWSGFVLGGVLAFNSYTLSNIGQAQLLHLEWMLLALLYLGKLLQRPRWRYALLLALFLAMQFYTAIYYGLFGFVVVGLVGGVSWLLKTYNSVRERLTTLTMLAVSSMVAILACLPLAIPYYRLSEMYGYERSLAETWPFSASMEMWLSASTSNLMYGRLLGGGLPKLGFYPVDALFPGVILLAGSICGTIMWFWRDRRSDNLGKVRWPVFLILGLSFFFILSLGPYLQIESLQPNFGQELPYAWLHEWVPGFQALRAPGRFAIVVFLGLATATAYTFSRVRGQVLKSVFILLLIAEMLSVPSSALFVPTTDADQRALSEWLAVQVPSAYLELPAYPFGMEGKEAEWLASQFQSIYHWQSTPIGYSGFFPPRYDEFLRYVNEFPKPEVVSFLQGMGIEWIALHRDQFDDTTWQKIESAIHEGDWEIQKWGDIWAVNLPKFTVSQPEQHFVIPNMAQAGGILVLGAILTNRQPIPVVLGSDLGHLRIEWWRGERLALAITKVVQPPFFVDPVAVSSVEISVPEEPGLYALKIYGSRGSALWASAEVTAGNDVVAPESQLLPVAGVKATIVCDDEEARVEMIMRTIGWYDEPFTLSVRVIDANGTEVLRGAADVEFGVEQPRSDFRNEAVYAVPLDVIPGKELGPLSVDIIAYQWQQDVERIVARNFVGLNGAVVGTLRLPLEWAGSCV